jgi:antirestriction protein ArdC
MANANSTSTRPNVYQIITDRVISQLEQGCAPWHKPWSARGESAIPRNLRTLKPYRGINVWILMSAGFSSPYFLTYKQAQELGGCVRKGEKGLPVVFWKFGETEKESETGETEKHEYAMCRYYTVFNVSQCEGLQVTPVVAPSNLPDVPAIDICESIVAGWTSKPEIKHGSDHASYHKVLDYINMPDRNSFEGSEEYYSTLFHELTHSTGHPKRLARQTLMDVEKFGDANYSREELVAEMGSAFLCGFTGIETKTLANSTSYIAGWLKALRNDSKLVLVAAGQAQKAADMILGSAATLEPEPKGTGANVAPVVPTGPVPEPVAESKPSSNAVFAWKGHDVFFSAISYNCPSLKLFGYRSDVAIKSAITRKVGKSKGIPYMVTPVRPNGAPLPKPVAPIPNVIKPEMPSIGFAITAKSLAVAARAACPISAIPIPGERPVLIVKRVLSTAIRNMTIRKIELVKDGDGHRSIVVAGVDSKNPKNCRRYSFRDQPLPDCKKRIAAWVRVQRKKTPVKTAVKPIIPPIPPVLPSEPVIVPTPVIEAVAPIPEPMESITAPETESIPEPIPVLVPAIVAKPSMWSGVRRMFSALAGVL